MSNNRESFYLPKQELRTTTNADGSRTVIGLIPYNSPSAGLPWVETIAPGAFADALKPGADVLMLRDHLPELLLGRTISGTLTLRDSAEGLVYSCKLPNTSTGNDLAESLERRDISGTSFGFITEKDDIANDGKGNYTRKILKVTLFEVSCCSFPAFPDSTAALRAVPKAMRSLLTRSAEDENEDDCTCERDPDGNKIDPDCHCDDEDDDGDENEDRTTLNWAERTLLTLKVMSMRQFS